ncbi:TetR/AcrR family transcriptional regulator [Williamsia soli]|uniref:TetR/AcrR family transcriptional regulator n=1 Tax=Williamsia soli TaxID=364929 RepID=UPI001A9CFA55|nr:TetR/AcrR family transcriptional regulator [Williamsia soli]
MPDQEPVRERLVKGALELFEERGYDATSVGDVAARAQVGRTTLFRYFGSKEALVFPDHDLLMQQCQDRLSAAGPSSMSVAVTDCARIVLDHYLAEDKLARSRYRLTSSVPALRDHEIATVSRYVRLFTKYLQSASPDDAAGQLRAELFSHAVVAAHNHVLRRWLRGEINDARHELTTAMETAQVLLRPSDDLDSSSAVVILSTNRSIESLLPQLRQALDDLET